MGYSKEAYQLIIAYAKQKQATGILSNTSGENYAAVALLHSLDFKQHYTTATSEEIRLVFINDFTFERERRLVSESLKKLLVFCEMYLDSSQIPISPSQYIKRGGDMHKGYNVNVMARNTLESTPSRFFSREIGFVSDGVIIMALDDNVPHVAYIRDKGDYSSAWSFCWQCCLV